MGTRLLITRECPIHRNLRHALINATETDTMIVMRQVGAHRVWNNAAARKCAEIKAAGASFEEILRIVSGENSRRVHCEGMTDVGVVPSGQGTGQVHDIPTVRQLLDRTIEEAS